MTGAVLRASPDELRRIGQEIGDVSNKLRDNLEHVNILLAHLSLLWSDSAGEDLIQRAASDIETSQDLRETLNKLSDRITSLSASYQAAESAAVNHIFRRTGANSIQLGEIGL